MHLERSRLLGHFEAYIYEIIEHILLLRNTVFQY